MSATLDALVAETRRLRWELRQCEDRLRAIERSRWWRLHPRRLRGGAAHVDAAGAAARATAVPTSPQRDTHLPATDDPSLASFRDEVVARGTFSQDWVTPRFARWAPILSELEGRPTRILEIGSFEGLSACFFLWRLPLAEVSCVDSFAGIPESVGTSAAVGLEETFDANVALVDASRVRKLVGDSKQRLVELSAEEGRFELVYVDGSHFGLDVLVDAALSWSLLTPGGVIVFDDYRWAYLGEDPLLRPGEAIDAFRKVVAGRHEVVFEDDQIALRRTV